MSVRKRAWVTTAGEQREAWIVDYVDQAGDRHIRTFARKKDADAFRDTVGVDVRTGTHTAPSKSITVREAGAKWLETGENDGLEKATLASYSQHLHLHMIPIIGSEKLSALTTASIRAFEDKLREKGCSADMRRRVLVSLGTLIADARERGLVSQNVVRDMRSRRKRSTRGGDHGERPKLKVGVDIPTTDEIKRIIAHLSGRWCPLFMTAIFTGLRASELRGLRWDDINLKRGILHVRQRADRFNAIGKLKSRTSERDVPLPPALVSVLREWRLACPKGEHGLAFPNGAGNIENHANIQARGFWAAQIKADVVNKEGGPKYMGLHSLRHFFASWCINTNEDGGLGLPPKVVQEYLGHASITMTIDRYGHLFPRGDDGSKLAAAAAALIS
jgi:integrase